MWCVIVRFPLKYFQYVWEITEINCEFKIALLTLKIINSLLRRWLKICYKQRHKLQFDMKNFFTIPTHSFCASWSCTPWALSSNELLTSKQDSISPVVLLKLSCPHQAKLQAAIWYNSIIDPFSFLKGVCALGSLLKSFKSAEKSQAPENQPYYTFSR